MAPPVGNDSICIIELIDGEISPDSGVHAVVEILEQAQSEARSSEACPRCGSPLYRIRLTGELYCFNCKSYVNP